MHRVMAGEDEEGPPLYFGDYPHGAYWSAVVPEGAAQPVVSDEEYFSYEGSLLRIMWDEDAGPLWGEEGLLGEDAEWMRRALGLSDSLIADLLTWMSDMAALHYGPSVADWRERGQRLDARGRGLAERLQQEVGSRYKVWYHP